MPATVPPLKRGRGIPTNEKNAVDGCVLCMYGPQMDSADSARSRTRRPIGLSALRGFEAAARLLSFTAAAQLVLDRSGKRTRRRQGGEEEFHRQISQFRWGRQPRAILDVGGPRRLNSLTIVMPMHDEVRR